MKKLLLITFIFLFNLDTLTVKAQWQQTNGPYGFSGSYFLPTNYDYRSNSVMSVEKSGMYLFAGVHGGVMVSTNNGNIWNRSLEVDSAFALKYNGINLYAGTESGFYISTNNGATWTQSNAGLTNTTVLSFAVNGSSLFAGTRGGVFVSTNNGVSWSPSYIGMPSTSVNALLVDGLNIFAGTNQGIFLSTNNGLTWTVKNTGMTGVPAITSFTKNGINIFVGVVYYGTVKIYLTINNGNSWTNVGSGLPLAPAADVGTFVSSIGTKIFAGGTFGICQSLDNGATWTTSNNSFGQTRTLFTDGTNLYQGGTNGLYLSTDNGNSWKNLGLGKANIVNALATNGTKIFAATGNGIYYTSDDGNTWEKSLISSMPPGPSPSTVGYIPRNFNAIAVSGSNVFASSPDGSGGGSGGQGTLWRSIDGGISWDRIISDTLSNDTLVTAIGIWGSKVFIGTMHGLYSSLDNGNSWTLMTAGLPTGGTYSESIIPSGPVIFATISGCYLSTDGVNWTDANLTSGGVVLAANGPNIYATSCFSNNYGSTWTPWTLPANTNSLVVKGDTLIALRDCISCGGTESYNAFISINNGITWDTINNGIQDCGKMGALILKGNNVFAASGNHWGDFPGGAEGCSYQNNGVFRADLSTIVLGVKEAKENSDLLVYPNPTSSGLTINTSVNYSSIQIVNTLGQVVFTKEKSASLNVSSLPSGIYFIQLVDNKGSVIGNEKFVKE